MKILVTGGAGFIGSSLCEYLVNKNYKVIVVDNLKNGNLENLKKIKHKIKFIKKDISKKNCFEDKNFEGIHSVFHLAALADIVPSIKFPRKYFESNVIGTLNVLEFCRNNNVKKLIYAASSSCYGLPKNLPVKENDIIDTRYPYSSTKYIGEKLILDWAKIYKMHNVSLRFFNAYGPRSRTNNSYGAMFGVFLSQKINNKPLTVVGSGKQTRDFIFISDLINGIIKAWQKGGAGEIYNIASGKETSVNQIVKLLEHKIVKIPKRPGEPDRLLSNINKAKKKLGFKPKVDIKAGVKIMINNISNWKKTVLWTPKKIKIETKEWFRYLGK